LKALLYLVALTVAPLIASAEPAQSPAKPADGKPAPSAQPAAPAEDTSNENLRRKAGGIITQPARDVGLALKAIPPVLVKAADDPYGLDGLKTCKSLVAAIRDLNGVLGPDYVAGSHKAKESRASKLAAAGGEAVLDSVIPFRGLVREASGAAPAERKLNEAIEGGLARRGFLRGVHRRQGCKPAF
jgi:hypothetical protein